MRCRTRIEARMQQNFISDHELMRNKGLTICSSVLKLPNNIHAVFKIEGKSIAKNSIHKIIIFVYINNCYYICFYILNLKPAFEKS